MRSELREVSISADGEEKEVIGVLALFYISDMRVRREDVVEAIEKAGAGALVAPPEIRPHNAWRRATQSVNHEDISINGYAGEVLIRNWSTDKEMIRRVLVRELKDEAAGHLKYREVAELIFDRASGGLLINELDTGNNEYDYGDFYRTIRDRYEEYRNYYIGNALRYMLRKALEKNLDAVLVRDGVYFVRNEKRPELSALEDAISMIDKKATWKRDKLDFMGFPVVRTPKNSKWLGDRVENRLNEEVSYLVSEIRARSGSRLHVDVAADYFEKAVNMKRRINEYSEYLEMEMEKTSMEVEVLEKEAKELLERVEAERAEV